jgi:2'-5' RNA ligase
MLRLFIALPIPEQAKHKLGVIIEECRQHGGSVKWVKPENMHLTVRFLGDCNESIVPALKQLLDQAATDSKTAAAVIDHLGGFPNLRQPRVIWAGIGTDTTELEKMAHQVEMMVRDLRFPEEKKKFNPHLTLGRVRNPPTGLAPLLDYLQNIQMEPIESSLSELVLFKSTLTPRGPIYERLHEAKLGVERFG